MTAKDQGAALLGAQDADAPFADVEELRSLVAEGRERGFVTFDEVASTLEEVEVTKEQIQELHGYLVENGIDVVGADGQPTAVVAEPKTSNGDTDALKDPAAPKKPEIDLTVEPSLDSLRLYLRSIGRVELLTAGSEVITADVERETRFIRRDPSSGSCATARR